MEVFKQYFSPSIKPEDVTSVQFYFEPPSGVCKATKLYSLPFVHHLCVKTTFKLLSQHLGTEKINGAAKWKSAHDNGGCDKSAREGGDTSTDRGDRVIKKKGSNICTYPACIYKPVPVSYPQRPGGERDKFAPARHGYRGNDKKKIIPGPSVYWRREEKHEEKDRDHTELNIPACVFMAGDVRPKLISK